MQCLDNLTSTGGNVDAVLDNPADIVKEENVNLRLNINRSTSDESIHTSSNINSDGYVANGDDDDDNNSGNNSDESDDEDV